MVFSVAATAVFLTSRARPVREVKAWLQGATLLSDDGVVFQTSSADCGIAALATLLEDRAESAAWQARASALLDAHRLGLSLAELAALSRLAEVPAQPQQIPYDALLEHHLPVIALVGSHYVIVESITDDDVVIVDPDLGRLAQPLSALESEWSGLVLAFPTGGPMHRLPTQLPEASSSTAAPRQSASPNPLTRR